MSLSQPSSSKTKIEDHEKAKILLAHGSIKQFLLDYIEKNDFHYKFSIELHIDALEEAHDNIEDHEVSEEWDDDDNRYEFMAEDLSRDDCSYSTWEDAAEEWEEIIALRIGEALIEEFFGHIDNDFVRAAADIIKEWQV